MALNNDMGFFNAHPPTLEDAGLEDTALPTHSIQEAFKRASDALQSAPWRLHSAAVSTFESLSGEEEGTKIANGGNGLAALGAKESCVDTKAGGLKGEGHDLVVGPDVGQYESDKVEFGKEKEGPKLGDKGCVEGLPGDRGEDKGTADEREDGPILVLA